MASQLSRCRGARRRAGCVAEGREVGRERCGADGPEWQV